MQSLKSEFGARMYGGGNECIHCTCAFVFSKMYDKKFKKKSYDSILISYIILS